MLHFITPILLILIIYLIFLLYDKVPREHEYLEFEDIPTSLKKRERVHVQSGGLSLTEIPLDSLQSKDERIGEQIAPFRSPFYPPTPLPEPSLPIRRVRKLVSRNWEEEELASVICFAPSWSRSTIPLENSIPTPLENRKSVSQSLSSKEIPIGESEKISESDDISVSSEYRLNDLFDNPEEIADSVTIISNQGNPSDTNPVFEDSSFHLENIPLVQSEEDSPLVESPVVSSSSEKEPISEEQPLVNPVEHFVVPESMKLLKESDYVVIPSEKDVLEESSYEKITPPSVHISKMSFSIVGENESIVLVGHQVHSVISLDEQPEFPEVIPQLVNHSRLRSQSNEIVSIDD